MKFELWSTRVRAKWNKARARAAGENKSTLLVLICYINRKVTRRLQQVLLVIDPDFDFMKWKTRSQEEALRGYLVNRSAPSNNFLWDLVDLNRMDTILELGSNSGNRLIEVASRFPEKTFVGVDINISAVTLDNEWANTKGIKNLEFIHADITSPQFYAHFLNRKFDCLVTWASLIYIHPIRIKKLIQFLLAITSKQIVLIEQNDSRLRVFPKYLGIPVPGEPTWVRNYEKILSLVKSDKTFDVNLKPVPEEIWHPGGGFTTVVSVTIQEVSTA